MKLIKAASFAVITSWELGGRKKCEIVTSFLCCSIWVASSSTVSSRGREAAAAAAHGLTIYISVQIGSTCDLSVLVDFRHKTSCSNRADTTPNKDQEETGKWQ
jgi:hypothetical protein